MERAMSPNTPEARSIPDAAAAAGVSRGFLYQAMRAGELPFVKLGKRRVIRTAALQAWLASKEQRAA
jgi:excisionase family DNA binding protein